MRADTQAHAHAKHTILQCCHAFCHFWCEINGTLVPFLAGVVVACIRRVCPVSILPLGRLLDVFGFISLSTEWCVAKSVSIHEWQA